MVSSMTPIMMSKLVPPKNWLVSVGTCRSWLRGAGQDGEDGEEDGAGQREARHGVLEEVGGGRPGAHAGDEPPLRLTSSAIWIGLNMNETQK
jgi:hypothetical protein